MPYAEIELALHPLGQSLYQVDLRITDPNTEAVFQPAHGQATLTTDALEDFESKPLEYGALLTDLLFKDPAIREGWIAARAAFQKAEIDIRLRLLLTPGDALLHSFRWELLVDPISKLPLATSKEILFSRLLFSRDWRNVKLRPKGDLKVVIAVAAPANLKEKFKLAPVDAAAETAPIVEAIAPIVPQVAATPLTLAALLNILESSPDIVYLIAHGTIVDDEPFLFLCDEANQTVMTPAKKLAENIARLDTPPRLIVLASCQSAGFSDTSQASLATHLSAAGVPAVIAMQGNITMKSVRQAMPRFFEELFKDGQIDRALSVARFEVRDNQDAWMPALLLRLKSGRIWYDPGFKSENSTSDFWNEICLQIYKDKALPIVGPNLSEDSIGSSSDIAQSISDSFGFPLSPSDRGDLAKVSQYLLISQGPNTARTQVKEQMVKHARKRFPQIASEDLKGTLKEVAALEHADAKAPFTILAGLPVTNFIDASGHSLLLYALRAAGKAPSAKLSAWRPVEGNSSLAPPDILSSELSIEKPLLYGIFGDCLIERDWVLTEDDFLDFLVRSSEYKLLPPHVSTVLCKRSLLFLGFDLDSWIFRVLFRLIMLREGIALQRGQTHIGVQLDPDDTRFADPERARKYLINYFQSSRRGSQAEPEIEVYWGSASDFLRQLSSEMEQRKHLKQLVASESEDDR